MTRKTPNFALRLIWMSLFLAIAFSFTITTSTNAQVRNITGRYVFKTHREGRGGFENHLEITGGEGKKFHVSLELTYFYLAGKDETFHEGSGEGEGQLNGNVLTANLSDGGDGSCRVSLTFNDTIMADEFTVTLKSSRCQLNVVPDGVYRKEKVNGGVATKRAGAAPVGMEVCPDPKAPCTSATHKFAVYEMPFRLPAKLRKNQTYTSAPFYAVLIKTFANETCDADDHTESIERERLEIQTTYPYNKVFALYSCPNLDAVEYNFPGLMDRSRQRALITTFIAVYAGPTQARANEFLGYVRTTYPAAALKRMTASYEIVDQ